MKNLQMRFLTNKETLRWVNILNVLERASLASAQKISEKTNISTRTIVKEIKAIREFFNDTIELKTSNSGYMFKVLKYKEYHIKKREIVADDPLFTLLNGILVGDIQTVEEWAFRFHLSESTMKRLILSVTPVLHEYNIQFSLTPVDFVGPEANIRKFFKDFYYEVEVTPHTLLPFEKAEELIFHLDKEMRGNLETNISPSDFQYFLYIMIYRSKQGKTIPEMNKKIVYSNKEELFLSSIKENIFKIYGFRVNENELDVLYIYFMSHRKISEREEEHSYCRRFGNDSIEKILSKKFIMSYEAAFKTTTLDAEFFVFVESFFVSTRWLDSISEIMNKNSTTVIEFCQNKYSKECAFSVDFLKYHYEQLHISDIYLEDIAAALILTIESIRDVHVRNSHKIAILLEGSYYIRRMIEAKVFRYLRGYHQIFFPTIEELTEEYCSENKIDLFVTNQEEYITELLEGIDFVLFKAIPDSEDWNQLLSRINPHITSDFSIGTSLSIDE